MALDFSDDIRYVKLILLHVKGGVFVAKKNILRISNLDKKCIDDYLKDNKKVINRAKETKILTEKQMRILFPKHSTPTDLTCWDISLYSYILLNLFGDRFKGGEETAIKALRETRNELAHSASTSMVQTEFLREWRHLTMALLQLTRLLTQAEQDEYNEIEYQIQTITDFHVAAFELISFNGSDEVVHKAIKEKMKSLDQKVNDCCNRVGEVETKMKRQQVVIRLVVSALDIIVKNTAQTKLVKTLQQIVSCEDKPIDDEVLAACNRLISEMKDQGVDIVRVEEGSILLTFGCPTISALKNICIYVAKGMYEKRLIEVEKSLSRYVESPVKLDMHIVLETLSSALTQIEHDADNRSVVLTLECTGNNAVDFFAKGACTNSLHNLSEALSRSVGEGITLHVDLPKTVLTQPEQLGREVDQKNQLTAESKSKPLPPPPQLTSPPWRKLPCSQSELQKRLEAEIMKLNPEKRPGFLVMGPVCSGKSSFINSCLTVGSGTKKQLAQTGSSDTSYTLKYSIFSDNTLLQKFRVYDCMGIEPQFGHGFNPYDITALLSGHVKAEYEFKPNEVFNQSSPYYNAFPVFEDKIHCVVLVIDAVTMHAGIPSAYVAKIKSLQENIKKADVPRVLILTKAEILCEEVQKDVSNIFSSVKVQEAVKVASEVFAIETASIHPVCNYEATFFLTTERNIPILLALRQILQYASDRAEYVQYE